MPDAPTVTRTVQQETLYADTDEPILIEFKETKGTKRDVHSYTVLSPASYAGKKEGCTGVTGFRDKSGILMQWAANMAVEAKASGKTDIEARYAHRMAKESAGDVGTRVHNFIEAYLNGEELPVDKDMKPCVDGFFKWWNENQPTTLWSERIVYSKEHDYAGKLDWGGVLRDVSGKPRYGLIDFKTGNADKEYNSYRKTYTGRLRAKTEHFVQNAGYDIPLSEEDDKKAEFYGVLYIPVTGDVQYFETTETELARETFLNTLAAKRAWSAAEKLNPYQLTEEES